jgi:hypothetical protein
MRDRLIVAAVAISLSTVGLAPLSAAEEDPSEHVVCEDPETTEGCEHGIIQNAVSVAEPGDTVRVLAGVYHEDLYIDGPDDLTIAGEGPGETILDGSQPSEDTHGIYVPDADGVTVRDLTVRNFEQGNGVYYSDITGFHVDNVHAIDNGLYGIYADKSTEGLFENSYATNHDDAGFYLGDVSACECVIDDVVSESNLIGYSGTSSSVIEIKNSVFRDNAAGIVPNVLDVGEESPSQMHVHDNLIVDNNNREMSQEHQVAGFYVPEGFGVINGGGTDNVWEDNTFRDHKRAGFAQTWLFNEPSFNVVRDNTFATSDAVQPGPLDPINEEPVDILWDAGGVDNCFEDNRQADGSDATFDAGTVWNTAGTLPDCQTPNAGAPAPTDLARQLSLMMTSCEPSEHLDAEDPILDQDRCDYSTLMP